MEDSSQLAQNKKYNSWQKGNFGNDTNNVSQFSCEKLHDLIFDGEMTNFPFIRLLTYMLVFLIHNFSISIIFFLNGRE